jgi:choline kinase
MEAVIPAAGYGRRLPVSPKALAQIGGEPLISHVIKGLKRAGIEKITVVVGFRAEDVKKRLDSREILFVGNPHYDKGSLYSLLSVEKYISEPFVFNPCDVLIDSQGIKKLISESEGIFTLGVIDRESSTEVDIDKSRVKKIGCGGYYSTGIAVLDPRIFDIAKRASLNTSSLKGFLEYCIKTGIEVNAVSLSDYAIVDVDTPEDLEAARRIFGDGL